MPKSKLTYPQAAQRFIKSAKSKGMRVQAEGGEIIAYPKQKAFMPSYGGKIGGKMSNGAGWGGEPVVKKKKLTIKNTPIAMLKRGMMGKKK